jgi:hypothetical protein
VIERSSFSDGDVHVDVSVSFGGPANSADYTGGATVTHVGGDFVCFDADLRAGTGVQAIGRVSAEVIRVDEELFTG